MSPTNSSVTEKENSDRVVAYGDRVAEAGNQVLATPAAPAPGAKSAAPAATIRTVEIFLIDPKGLMGKDLRAAVTSAVEKDLHALYATPLGREFVKQNLSAKFVVTYRTTMPSKAERLAFGALQYPMYILNAHTNDAATVGDIESILTEHGIRDAGVGKAQFEAARDGWKSKSVEGLGIQPLQGYRKVGFIKADKIYAARGDFEALFRNIVKHELGHMFNMKEHTDQVMRDGIVLSDASLGYSETQTRRILQEIVRLRANESALQAAYEQANR